MKLFSIFITSVILSVGIAKPQGIMTVTCEPPKGTRVDYGGEVETGEDAFTRVKPVFLIDAEEPQTMTVIWGDSAVTGVPESLLRTHTKKIPIVHLSEDQITGVERQETGIWVHSLYPKLKFGIFTRQTHYLTYDHAIGSLLYSRCRFEGPY